MSDWMYFQIDQYRTKAVVWWKFFIQFQNIVFKEYLPVIVGPQMIEEYDLKIDNGQTKYNPEQDPSVGNEFATVSVFAFHCICLCPILSRPRTRSRIDFEHRKLIDNYNSSKNKHDAIS